MRGPRRTAELHEAQRAAAASDAAARVLAEGAADAGLAWPAVAWARLGGSLAERLAANPFMMAPMAGVTDAAYRLMARAGGAALAYSEMVSVAGIHYKSDKTWELVDPNPAEPELAVQLFGADVDHFREAVPLVAERLGGRLALVDVNMACPVPKVTKSGAGSALLDEPLLAADIVRAIRDELDACGRGEVPVTAKIRIGRRPDAVVGPEFARTLEAAGAEAIAVHGRVASQLYRGQSNAAEVRRVVGAVGVPVIASGDALDGARAAALLAETGAAGCFVARGSYGNPWVFRSAGCELAKARALAGSSECAREADAGGHGGGVSGRVIAPCEDSPCDGAPCDAAPEVTPEVATEVTPSMRLAAFRLHVRLLEATGAHTARARSLAGWYLRGVPEAAAWRERAMHCAGASDYLALADELEASLG